MPATGAGGHDGGVCFRHHHRSRDPLIHTEPNTREMRRCLRVYCCSEAFMKSSRTLRSLGCGAATGGVRGQDWVLLTAGPGGSREGQLQFSPQARLGASSGSGGCSARLLISQVESVMQAFKGLPWPLRITLPPGSSLPCKNNTEVPSCVTCCLLAPCPGEGPTPGTLRLVVTRASEHAPHSSALPSSCWTFLEGVFTSIQFAFLQQDGHWTWNNRLVPNRKRSTSRLYIVTLVI